MPDPIAVYRETVGPLYDFVSRRCNGDRALAEDVTQEAYMRFIAECREKKGPFPALPWLYVVARNLLLNHFRRHRPSSVDPAVLDQALDRAETLRDEDRAAATFAIAWGMARLHPEWARLIDDFHFGGKSVGAISTELGLSERAVEGRLRRARAALRDVLRSLERQQENRREQ